MSTEEINENEIHEDSNRKKYFEELWEKTSTVQVTVDNETGPKYFEVFYKSNTEMDRLPVKEIPIDIDKNTGLWYNPFNSRILAYKLRKESELEKSGDDRKLSAQIKEDREYIQQVLLESAFYSGKATEDLEKELEETGQIDPAIISADGIIWNANRRVAIRQKLFKQTGDPKWNTVEAVRLPSLSFKQLKQLEHRLQMAKEFREEYGSVNLRLRCRQATNPPENWTMAELRNSFHYKYSKADIKKFIEEIDLIDEFLEFAKAPSDYPLIEQKAKGRGVEIFTALNDQIKWETEHYTKEEDEANRENIKYIGFSIIHNKNTTYKDVRNFRNILRKEVTRKAFLENSVIYKNPTEYIITTDDSAPLALKPETTQEEYNNLEKEMAVYESLENTPTEVTTEVLKKLLSIVMDRIDSKDEEFKKSALGVVERIDTLISKCDFTEQEANNFTVIIKNLATKFGYELKSKSL